MPRHAVITAGTKGLGARVTDFFLQNGYTVTVNYRRDEDTARAWLKRYKNGPERIQLVRGDVTKREDCLRMIDQAKEAYGRIDCLIHNAGPYIFERKKLFDYHDDEWHKMIDGNLHSAYYLIKRVLPIMRRQRFGRIITYGFQNAAHAPGWIYRSAYGAAKVGLVTLTKTVALEEAEFGITANMVCPGNIVGEMKEATISEARENPNVAGKAPVGRAGTGEDIARTIGFLCEADSDMITGSVIEVTGGIDVIHRFRHGTDKNA